MFHNRLSRWYPLLFRARWEHSFPSKGERKGIIDGDERQIVKRKLFAIEQVAEMKIAYVVTLEGRFSFALPWPACRTSIQCCAR